uniref:Putative secreted protein n=1 Tax=Anopheles marajoara TaxID=58244 RepID=A0A2M4CEM3_9DIPT
MPFAISIVAIASSSSLSKQRTNTPCLLSPFSLWPTQNRCRGISYAPSTKLPSSFTNNSGSSSGSIRYVSLQCN